MTSAHAVTVLSAAEVAKHLETVHGWRRVLCPTCTPETQAACMECEGKGDALEYHTMEPCGPGCPLVQPKGAA